MLETMFFWLYKILKFQLVSPGSHTIGNDYTDHKTDEETEVLLLASFVFLKTFFIVKIRIFDFSQNAPLQNK